MAPTRTLLRVMRRAWSSAGAAGGAGGGPNVPRHSWSVFHPTRSLAGVHPIESLRIMRFPHLNLIQTSVHPSKFQTHLMRWGSVLAVASAVYQFVTNLHTVPITGRTQVVVLSREEECELGNKAAAELLQGADVVMDGPRLRMCVDIAARLVSVSEHLFPREYDWRVWLVDNPGSANACCAPGGKIIVQTGLLDLIDFAVAKGICESRHDALAVVLAHEIAHALARHTAESTSLLPLMYLQAVLGLESPLLQYIFQFAMNLPFSRRQEMEADHIGLMLLASACYDPREAPRLWRAFSAFFQAEQGVSELELALDFHSTHPSNYKRERYLEQLLPEALELQNRSGWCASLRDKVRQALALADARIKGEAKTESAIVRRVRQFQAHFQAKQVDDDEDDNDGGQRLGRRHTVGTMHELENREVFRAIREQEQTAMKDAGSASDATKK